MALLLITEKFNETVGIAIAQGCLFGCLRGTIDRNRVDGV